MYTPLPFDFGVLLGTPNYMACESDNTKFMMGSSGFMVTWWPVVQHSVFPKVRSRSRALSQKESMICGFHYLWMMKGPRFKILNASTVICLLGPAEDSKWIPTYIIGPAGSHGPSGGAACRVAWTCCRVSYSPEPQSKLAFFVSLGQWAKVTN